MHGFIPVSMVLLHEHDLFGDMAQLLVFISRMSRLSCVRTICLMMDIDWGVAKLEVARLRSALITPDGGGGGDHAGKTWRG